MTKPCLVVVVDALEYERNHGASPRGRGSWAFCLVDPRRGDYLEYCVWVNGIYSDARRAAVQLARRLPVDASKVTVSFGACAASRLESSDVDLLFVCS